MFTSTEMSSEQDLISMHRTGLDNATDTEIEPSSYNDPLADVFGSAPTSPSADLDEIDDLTNPDSHQQQAISSNADPSDIPRLRSTHVTNGYREGIAVGKEQSIQVGFDEGYMIGAEFGLIVGYIKGTFKALLSALSKTDVEAREVLQREIAQSSSELKSEALFSPEYFDEDGIWSYNVLASAHHNQHEHSETDVTFRDVAAQHPVVAKWSEKAEELARQYGLDLPPRTTRNESSEESNST